jgi:NitT/TauT family transport system ATP-binding protein
MIAVELDHVSRDFLTPDGRGYRALDDISLSISAGSFTAIVGPSGCGKSTLLNIVAGLLAPSTGSVRVDGEALAGLNRRATYMFQQDALLPWKTVRENVALGLTLGGVPRSDAHARADGWLTRVGLAGFAAHYPSQLSGGMRKRVVMAQNWIIDRGIVLMDEPFSALDVHTRQRMETELLELWEGSGSSRTLPEPSTSPEASRPEPSTSPEASRPESSTSPEALGPEPSTSPEASGPEPSTSPEASVRASVVSGFSQTGRKTIVFVTHDLEEAIALADEVVILSAGPAARVVARHPVGLERPRDLMELRTAPAFVDLYRAIWAVLREEVIRSQRAVERGRA